MRERHWRAWRETLPPVDGRPAAAEQTLWHELAMLPMFARARARCGEEVPQDRTVMKFAGTRPPGTICTDCRQLIAAEELRIPDPDAGLRPV